MFRGDGGDDALLPAQDIGEVRRDLDAAGLADAGGERQHLGFVLDDVGATVDADVGEWRIGAEEAEGDAVIALEVAVLGAGAGGGGEEASAVPEAVDGGSLGPAIAADGDDDAEVVAAQEAFDFSWRSDH